MANLGIGIEIFLLCTEKLNFSLASEICGSHSSQYEHSVFLDVMSWSLIDGTEVVEESTDSTLNMEALRSFKMLANFYQTTGQHIPEDFNVPVTKKVIKACFFKNATIFPARCLNIFLKV